MAEKADCILEFQVAKKFASDQNNTGIRLRKICTMPGEELTAEATVLAKTTAEYDVLRQDAEGMTPEVHCKGAGKSLKISTTGDNANLDLLKFMARVGKLEPEAKLLLGSTLEFMGEGDSAISPKISGILDANCDISIRRVNLENGLFLIDYTAKIDRQVTKADFFEALSKINKNEEFGIIK